MATFKGIKGFTVQNLPADPLPLAQAQAADPYVGSWSSGGNLNTARTAGTNSTYAPQGAGMTFGGATPGTASGTVDTEKYNGSSWTEVNNLNTGRKEASGAGTQTSSLMVSGYNTGFINSVEEYNGTNWSEIAEVNAARGTMAGWGANAENAIIAGGNNSQTTAVESWNGSSWSEIAELNTGRYNVAGFGASNTSGIVGPGTGGTSSVELWNGSSWTEVAEVNTARVQAASAGLTSTAGLIISGYVAPAGSVNTESWNGSTWTEVNNVATARWDGSAGGSSSSALFNGGDNPGGKQTATEEWSFSGIPPASPVADYTEAIVGQFYFNSASNTFKYVQPGVGAWASGGALGTSRYGAAGTGSTSTQAAGLVFGGDTGSGTRMVVSNRRI